MKIAITGGSGFIGGHVMDEALARGHEVVVFDPRGGLSNHRAASAYPTKVSVTMGDVRDSIHMSELAAHVDGIIHLAACLGTQETIRNPRPAAVTNVMGGLNFLEACAQYGIPGVNIGVGNHWMSNPYSITKSTVERFVKMFNAERGTRINQVRAVNAYGPRQSVAPPYGPAKVRKILPSFICRALTGDPIEVYGDGSQISDMVHVSDVASALVQSLEYAANGPVLEEIVEIGPAESFTVYQIAQMVRDQVTEMTGISSDIVRLPMRPGEIVGARVSADHSTLPSIGMRVDKLIPLSVGITETVEYYLRNWLPKYRAENSSILKRHECTETCTPGNCPVQDF